MIKSTVPVGTNAELARRMAEATAVPFDVGSNPEFLKEGAAIDDFNKPDRVVVGVRRPEVAERLHALYAPFLRTDRPFLVMTPESAEMTKYVANCLLATKISFINEMANLCEAYGADVNDVRRGIGHDQRIGFHFLFPGVGYGGSCFPKDIRAVIHMAQSKGLSAWMMEAVDAVNEAQKDVLFRKIHQHFHGELEDKTIAVWGTGLQAADRRRPRGAGPGPDRIAFCRPAPSCGSTTPRRWATSAPSTASGLLTATAPTVRLSRPTPWPSSPSGTSSATPTSR